ncbi:GTPase IMAP family member 7-like isoform X2 [Osmerus mordax]|uniref:GTPase IMAP family member 7-like isoform X2 n=1 Tax=Osmerus mordax TaxID=8014 RepID=UPI00350F1C0B
MELNNPAKNDVMPEWTIMLIGKSGVGKSSSGNTIIGSPVFQSDMKLARVTRICEKEKTEVDGRPISVIDTPGLFETNRKEKEILREILKRVKLQEPGLHAFVVVVPLGRLTMEDQETNLRIEAAFGPHVWDYTIVLFTYGDRLEGKAINDVIASSDSNLRDFIRKCSGGFLVFDNKNADSKSGDQVSRLLEKIDTLVALNGGRCYSSQLYPPKERRVREKQESILAEKDGEIRRKERELEDKYKDEELKKKRQELWIREEEEARQEAESQPSKIFYFAKFLIVFTVLTGVAYYLLKDHFFYLAVLVLGGCLLFKDQLVHVVGRWWRKLEIVISS